MSKHIEHLTDDQAWIVRVTDALAAVRSVYKSVSRENGNTDRLTRQMRYLKRALAAWLDGHRDRARGLLAAALHPDLGPPPADREADAAASNGQADVQTAPGPKAQRTAPERTPPG